jgi:hypothetical protein
VQQKFATGLRLRRVKSTRESPSKRLFANTSCEFDAARRDAIKRVVAKYAYTAQHEGFVLRKIR